MRDYEQAAQDIGEVKPFFEEIETCKYALWTNGLEFFFLRKKATRFQVKAEPIGDWPPADESIGDRNVLSRAHARRADPEMLRIRGEGGPGGCSALHQDLLCHRNRAC